MGTPAVRSQVRKESDGQFSAGNVERACEPSPPLVQHKVYLSLWKTPAQRVKQRRAENGITHLTETDYEYLIQFTVHSSQFKSSKVL